MHDLDLPRGEETIRTSRYVASCVARRADGRSLASWSKGRTRRYAYYHCPGRCRAINVSKAVMEGAFVDELALLQPTAGYMRLVKDRNRCVWQQRCAEAVDELDVEGILAFAERILPRASDLWVQASLDYKPRLQQRSSRKESRSTEIALVAPP